MSVPPTALFRNYENLTYLHKLEIPGCVAPVIDAKRDPDLIVATEISGRRVAGLVVRRVEDRGKILPLRALRGAVSDRWASGWWL